MKVAIDVSPLSTGHKVRGVGFYLKHLKQALEHYKGQYAFFFFTDKKELEGKQVDVIHYPYFDPFFLTLPLLKKVKTIVTVHDLTPLVFPKAFPSGIKGKIRWEIQKMALQRVDAIIADSESSKRDIVRLTGVFKDTIHVVYLAAGEEFKVGGGTNKKALLEKYHLPNDFVLYVGDVTWNKNLPRLLDAVTDARIPLVMVGKALTETEFDYSNPWNEDRIKVLNKAKENKNIYRLGFLPNEDVVGLYNAATAFVFPSLYEGFGLPIVEAMSCGTPVITTKCGSIPEVGGDAVYYVDAESVTSIAKGIIKVFSDKKLQESLRERGLQQAKKFSWKKTGEETIRVYSL